MTAAWCGCCITLLMVIVGEFYFYALEFSSPVAASLSDGKFRCTSVTACVISSEKYFQTSRARSPVSAPMARDGSSATVMHWAESCSNSFCDRLALFFIAARATECLRTSCFRADGPGKILGALGVFIRRND